MSDRAFAIERQQWKAAFMAAKAIVSENQPCPDSAVASGDVIISLIFNQFTLATRSTSTNMVMQVAFFSLKKMNETWTLVQKGVLIA